MPAQRSRGGPLDGAVTVRRIDDFTGTITRMLPTGKFRVSDDFDSCFGINVAHIAPETSVRSASISRLSQVQIRGLTPHGQAMFQSGNPG